MLALVTLGCPRRSKRREVGIVNGRRFVCNLSSGNGRLLDVDERGPIIIHWSRY